MIFCASLISCGAPFFWFIGLYLILIFNFVNMCAGITPASFVQNFGFEIILTMYYKLVMQCSVEECPNPPLAHGLCSDHSRISFAHHHPISGIRNGADVTMAGRFFHSLSIEQPQGEEKLEVVLPVVRVPFIHDEATFRYHNYRRPVDERGYPVDERGNPVASFNHDVTKLKTKLELREELESQMFWTGQSYFW